MGDKRYQSRSQRDPIHTEAESLTFGMYSSSEVRSLSTCLVTSPVSFNQLGHPLEGGLYDLKMGPYSDRDNLTCTTCYLNSEHCPGHIGHIELPMPVVNSFFYSTILRMLKITCLHCHKFKMPNSPKTLFLVQMKLLDVGLINSAQKAVDIADRKEEREERRKKVIDQTEDLAMDIKLKEFAEVELSGVSIEENVNNRNATRSVESLRKEYLKKVMSVGQVGTCPHCGAVTRRITLYKSRFIYEGLKMDDSVGGGEDLELTLMGLKKKTSRGGEKEKSELNASELRDHFRFLFSNDPVLLSNMFTVMKESKMEFPTDIFFLEVVPIPPPRVRPVIFTGGMLTLHPQSQALQNVIESVAVIKPLVQVMQGADLAQFSQQTQEMITSLRGETSSSQLDLVWKELQNHIDHVVDRDLNASRNQKQGWGFKQLIERKQGIFRMFMMGKRVNHCCRTVITPDPNINIDEVGVPEVFATKLSYQVPVNPWNVAELREMILNGPDVHPGAVMVENEVGQKTMLESEDRAQREGIAKTLLTPTFGGNANGRPKIVYRHLKNGDPLLLNRQPSLHKPSIMAHRARVLKGEKVMRLHYSNCKSYNADFDGDEMNAHYPQSEMARAESYEIVKSDKQFLVPKDGSPLQGLIQDHIIGGVKMTMRGRFFDRGEYQQWVYHALVDVPGRIKLLPPAIMKPRELWSGKQIWSTIIINLVPKDKQPPNLKSGTKIKGKEWIVTKPRPWKGGGKPEANPDSMTEAEVVIRGGELCCGILDKQQYGPTPYSLIHLFCELYGGKYWGMLLSAISKMMTNFLKSEGFSLGVEDILVTRTANLERNKIMEDTASVGDKCAAEGVGIKGDFTKDFLKSKLEHTHRGCVKVPKRRMDLDRGFKAALNPATNAINSCCLPNGLIKKFPHNNLQLMVNAGAKGSTVNTMQISCLLGQIELEGKRPPIQINGKSLPSFKAYDTQPRAGGFIDGRFMTGIQPQEFFFHCMAGREGLIDTAVKTSRSGYLQRCVIKLLEGLVVNYDNTVREADGSVVQFQYGEDSLDVCKSQYLKKGKLDYLAENLDAAFCQESVNRAKAATDLKAVKKMTNEVKDWKKRNVSSCGRRSKFLTFCRTYGPSIKGESQGYSQISKGKEGYDKVTISRLTSSLALLDTYRKLPEDLPELREMELNSRPSPDPIVSTLFPSCHFGSLTERVDKLIEEYISSKDSEKFPTNKFRDMIYAKAQLATVAPGEPVGILAAQSVGEPSTQMTLNTFHFAGRGEMNVTLGIPRLREILMVASANIKTPSMDIPFKSFVGEKERDKLRLKFNKVVIGDLLEKVVVEEKIKLSPYRARDIAMMFKFLPHKNYKQNFGVKPAEVLNYFEKKFISKVLMPVMSAVTKEKKVLVETSVDTSTKAPGVITDEDEKRMDSAADKGMGEHESSDEEDVGDGDGTDVTRKKERQGDREYEELEEEDIQMNKQIDKEIGDEYFEEIDDEDDDIKPVNQLLETTDEGLGDEIEDEEHSSLLVGQKEAMAAGDPARRRASVLQLLEGRSGIANIVDYSFDTEKESWCCLTLSFDVSRKRVDMSNILKQAAAKGIVYEIKKLKRAFVLEEEGKMMLKTDGINIEEIFKHDKVLDIGNLVCNNIHDMAKYYGIEAANKTIVREITNVFSVYGIEVDKRHLSLIADYMTCDGSYKPFNRIGIENNPSPLQQMTFETAMGFLRSATLGGKIDNLTSPSACVVLGKPAKCGTGAFTLMQKLG